jgi:hypothetical protein
MPTRHLDRDNHDPDFFWAENNAAFTCSCCGSVFLVGARLNPHGLHCPRVGCGKSFGYVEGGKDSGGIATINWPDGNDVPN